MNNEQSTSLVVPKATHGPTYSVSDRGLLHGSKDSSVDAITIVI